MDEKLLNRLHEAIEAVIDETDSGLSAGEKAQAIRDHFDKVGGDYDVLDEFLSWFDEE